MISLQVGSMQASAKKLQSYLQSRGMKVWVCVDMMGGDNYRNEIIDAIEAADFFIILLNNKWALSGECEFEYNYAIRLNLTSYESGRTSRGVARKPVFIPIAFSDLDWGAHRHVRLLAANTNFIVHNDVNLVDSDATATIKSVASSIQQHGIELPDPVAPTQVSQLEPQSSPASTDSQDPETSGWQQAVALLADRVTKLEAQLVAQENGQPTPVPQIEAKQEFKAMHGPSTNLSSVYDPAMNTHTDSNQLGKGYLGNCLAYGGVNGVNGVPEWMSIHLENVNHDLASGRVECKVTRTVESVDWSAYTGPAISQAKKEEIEREFWVNGDKSQGKNTYTTRGEGQYDARKRCLLLWTQGYSSNIPSMGWGNETLMLTYDGQRLLGVCHYSGGDINMGNINNGIVLNEY